MTSLEMITTDMNFVFEDDKLCEADYTCPIIGGLEVDQEKIVEVLVEFATRGLKFNWDCIEKAMITKEVFGGSVVFGSLMVWSETMRSNFAYYFNPPLELHSWVVDKQGNIFDLSLPGVIHKALQVKDSQGYLVEGREPAILIGRPPDWLTYKIHEWMISQ